MPTTSPSFSLPNGNKPTFGQTSPTNFNLYTNTHIQTTIKNSNFWPNKNEQTCKPELNHRERERKNKNLRGSYKGSVLVKRLLYHGLLKPLLFHVIFLTQRGDLGILYILLCNCNFRVRVSGEEDEITRERGRKKMKKKEKKWTPL